MTFQRIGEVAPFRDTATLVAQSDGMLAFAQSIERTYSPTERMVLASYLAVGAEEEMKLARLRAMEGS